MASAKPQASEESLDDLFFDVENWLIMLCRFGSHRSRRRRGVYQRQWHQKPTGFLAGPPCDHCRQRPRIRHAAVHRLGPSRRTATSADIFYDLVYSLRAALPQQRSVGYVKLVLAALRKFGTRPTSTCGSPP